ncbi:M16 family metallopeptidase [Rubripirellula amarantea]|uniref:M16 family metallopeptidase n=1 Tax=Rubripirellula amarantea TaxID=2527999 RepID=UPI001F5EFB15|nr:pitrilysin family protein [Rubripirellula amarantea]
MAATPIFSCDSRLAFIPRILALGLIAAWLPIIAFADEPTKEDSVTESAASLPEKITEIEGISEYKLENGVRVLLFPDPSKEVVTVNMTVFVGSRHEGYGEAGMAHLLEHMLFKGTPSHPDIPKVLKDRGAGNSMNGTTWMDRTNYYETLPASGDNLEFAIRLEADRLVNSFIKGEDLESEMTVVRNEFESGENSPIRVLMQRMQSAAFDWHNYGRSTIGNRSDIERVPVVRLRKFYKKFYRPDNVMVVVAGKFEPSEALKHVEQYFGSLKKPDTPIDDTYTTEPAQDGERTVVLRRVGEVQFAGTAYHIPASSHPDFAAAKALMYIMGDEPSGRLYKNMVETKLASNVYAIAYAFTEPGLFMTIAEIPMENSLEQGRQTLIDIMEHGFEENPITEKELNRAVQQMLKSRELESADPGRLAISLSDWAAQGDWRLYFLFRDAIEALTVDDVQRVADRYFTQNNRTVGLFIPSEKSDRAIIPESPDLQQVLKDYKGREAMAAGEVFDPTPLAIEERTERGTLVGGIEYALMPKKTRGETVNLLMTLRFGTPETLADKVGPMELMGLLMSKGTEKLDNTELQDELTRLRTELSINSTTGVLQMSVKTKREFLPEVIELIADIARNPKLDAAELDVIKRQVVTGLQKSTVEPQALAPRAVRRALSPYPKGDVRYVQTFDEEIAMYESVTVDEIRSLHEDFLSNQQGELAVVGDFEADQVKSLLKDRFADWKSDIEFVRADREAHPEIAGETIAIETPDKANALLYSSQQYSLSDTDPEYASLVLGNYILGGGSLSSRLGNRVRQQEGLSYGVRSGLSSKERDKRVDFTLYAITNPGNKDRLLEVIMEELDLIRDQGVTEEELAQAKVAYLQAAKVRRTNDGAVAGDLLSTLFDGRTMAAAAEHESQIEAATVESVNSAIKKYIVPEKLVIAVAGDFAAAAKEASEKAANAKDDGTSESSEQKAAAASAN